MSENPDEPSVMGALPHTRPHRRSERRAVRPPSSTGRSAQPAPVPEQPERAAVAPEKTVTPDLLGTAVQALAELAEIGLTAGARALRSAVSRLPHP